jgi:ketosteroid isomerase-like protein
VGSAENAGVLHRMFEAFASRDAFALRDLLAEDAVWIVPGRGAMAGTYHGRTAILGFLARLPKETGGTYASALVDVLASEDRAAALYRATGVRGGRTLDLEQLLLAEVADGQVRSVLALPSDPEEFDAFWGAGPERVDA